MGTVLLMLASSLSNSLVFYYSSAMAVGVVLVILIVLFQVHLTCQCVLSVSNFVLIFSFVGLILVYFSGKSFPFPCTFIL